jgi:hypothetical protein
MKSRTTRETVGVLGVIMSVSFVGWEIRQNTLASRAVAIQESTNTARQFIHMFAEDAEANRIMMLGREDPLQLSEEEQARYRWMVTSFLWGMQGLHRQWLLGVLPDEEWAAWNRVTCGNMAYAGVQWVWEGSQQFTPSFRTIVEAC